MNQGEFYTQDEINEINSQNRRLILKASSIGLACSAVFNSIFFLSDSGRRTLLERDIKHLYSLYEKRKIKSKAEKLIYLGINEIEQEISVFPLMVDQTFCKGDGSKILAAAITNSDKPNYNIVLYAPESWKNMQISIFEKERKDFDLLGNSGDFVLNIMPWEIQTSKYDTISKKKLYVSWNVTGGFLNNRLDTNISLSPSVQKKAERFYSHLQRIVQGVVNKNINFRKCYSTPSSGFENFMK